MKTAGSTTLAALVALASVHCSGDTGEGGALEGTSGGRGGASIGVAGNQTGAGGSSGKGGIAVGGTTGIPTAGNSSAAASGTNPGGGEPCNGITATGQKGESAVVMLLVDTSRSMLDPAPGDNQSKLEATKAALNMAINAMPDGLGVGLVFYPGVGLDAEQCFAEQVAVPIAPINAAQKALLTGAVTAALADGSTPTHDAYIYALAQLKASTLEGTKYLVLITDGVPTYSLGCEGSGAPPGPGEPGVDTGPLVTESQNAFGTDMVKTFVIGTPGSEGAREGLSAMARVGGTGPVGCADTGTPQYCHFDMTESSDVAAGLNMALGAITQQIPVECNFEIPPPPNTLDLIDVTQTNVSYNGMLIPYDQTCTAESAWRFDDPAQPEQVIFCGTLCDQVNQAVAADMRVEVGVTFGCTRIDVPR